MNRALVGSAAEQQSSRGADAAVEGTRPRSIHAPAGLVKRIAATPTSGRGGARGWDVCRSGECRPGARFLPPARGFPTPRTTAPSVGRCTLCCPARSALLSPLHPLSSPNTTLASKAPRASSSTTCPVFPPRWASCSTSRCSRCPRSSRCPLYRSSVSLLHWLAPRGLQLCMWCLHWMVRRGWRPRGALHWCCGCSCRCAATAHQGHVHSDGHIVGWRVPRAPSVLQ